MVYADAEGEMPANSTENLQPPLPVSSEKTATSPLSFSSSSLTSISLTFVSPPSLLRQKTLNYPHSWSPRYSSSYYLCWKPLSYEGFVSLSTVVLSNHLLFMSLTDRYRSNSVDWGCFTAFKSLASVGLKWYAFHTILKCLFQHRKAVKGGVFSGKCYPEHPGTASQ